MTYHKQRIPLSEADHLGKETDEGSVEYKWKLVNISDDRLSHLVTQMKYRVAEGQGECIYEIGVDDSGLPKGLDESDYQESINTLKRMAEQLKCDLSIVCEKVVQTDPKMMCAEVMIRKFGEDDFVDVRVALCGHAGSGKSTLVGVLTRGTLDNGQGMARQKVFNHLHEIESGQTSSISQQILGFDSRGNVINYLSSNVGLDVTPQRIAEMSSKVCTLYDLAGHHKYIKTTVSGITGTTTDYACIVIRADTGIENTTKEHMGLCSSLKIPFFMVVTCIDLTDSSHLKNTLKSIRTLLKQPGVRKHFYHVRDEDDAIVSAKSIKPNRTVPVICVSNITGENLGLLRKFLNLLPVRREWEALAELPVQVAIDVVYLNVPEVKTVVAGLVEQGCVYIGDVLILGPDEDGKFRQVTIRGIQVKRVNVKKVEAGAHACFAVTSEEELEGIPGGLRKGMVLLDLKTEPTPEAYWRFEAYITILFASGTIQSNFQALLHCHGFRQKARIFLLNDPSGLRTGERALVQFEFMFQSEFIKEGMHLVFIEGSTKGIGSITRLIRVDQPPERSRFNSGNTRPRLGSRTKDSPLRKPTSPLTSAVPVDPSRIQEVSCSIPPKEETISNISIIEPNQQVPDQSIPQKQNDTSEGECSPLQSPLILQMPTEGKLKHTQSKREKRNSSTRKEKKQMNDEESSFNIYSD